MAAAETVTLRRPDDWHVHLRDGPMLRAVLPFTAERFARAIVMPNLSPPIAAAAAARAYRERILASLPQSAAFAPLMTCYLTDETKADDLEQGFREGVFTAAKLYPANATTNSAAGVTDVRRMGRVFERMEKIGMRLLIHGEVTDPDVDVFDREAAFVDQILRRLIRDFPALKIVLEHVTTKEAVDFVMASRANLAATITAHHLVINRSAIFVGGLRPHFYCLPVAKRESHRLALRRAATSGDSRFFLGTDSAPHFARDKERDCGCAGIFSAPAALEIYAQVFAEEGALARLEGFAAEHGPRFYGLPLNEGHVTLSRVGTTPPEIVATSDGPVRVFLGGQTLEWSIASPGRQEP